LPQHSLAAFRVGHGGRVRNEAGKGYYDEPVEALVELTIQRKLKRFMEAAPDDSKYFGTGEFHGFTKSSRHKQRRFGSYLYIDDESEKILAPGNEIIQQALRVKNSHEQFLESKDDWRDFTEQFYSFTWEKLYGLPSLGPNLWWFCDKTRYLLLIKDDSPFALLWDGVENHDASKIAVSELELQFEPYALPQPPKRRWKPTLDPNVAPAIVTLPRERIEKNRPRKMVSRDIAWRIGPRKRAQRSLKSPPETQPPEFTESMEFTECLSRRSSRAPAAVGVHRTSQKAFG